MKLILSLVLVLACFLQISQALNCWNCENANSNADCMKKGKLQSCQKNQQACQNEVRRHNKQLWVTKRCKQANACDNNYVQNKRAAWSPSQCNTKAPSSVCRCCCNFDACNAPSLGCLDSKREVSLRDNFFGRLEELSTCTAIRTPRFGSKYCASKSGSLSIGTECIFRCNFGYELVGASRSTCDQNPRTRTARFNNPPPTCRPTSCYDRQTAPTHGSVSCTNSNKFRSVCSFSCEQGYFLRGTEDIQCRSHQYWSQRKPTCVKVACPTIHQNPTNGLVTCSDVNNRASQCAFQCNRGFSLVGEPLSTCISDATSQTRARWSSDAPSCQRVKCPSLVAPSSGTYECMDGRNVGSECNFVCNAGYFMEGESQSTCLDDFDDDLLGVWSSPAPSCRILICQPSHTTPENGTMICNEDSFEGSDCIFACDDGFILNGSPVSQCRSINDTHIGAWSSPTPSCGAIRCMEQLNAPPNGTVSCSKEDLMGSECTFTCNPGFLLVGEQVTMCLDNNDGDEVGEWSSTTPQCELDIVTECSNISVLSNGEVSCSDFYQQDSVCTFSCNDGYTLSGMTYSICEKSPSSSGADPLGVWSSAAPTCERVVCQPEHAEPNHGSMLCTDGNLAESICTFACEVGYKLVGTSSMCQNNGAWNSPTPACIRQRCEPSPVANENSLKVCSDGDFLGSRCEFSCDGSYRRAGPRYSTCIELDGDFVWNDIAPTCILSQCGDVEPIQNGHVTCTDGDNANSVCEFQCNADQGYTLYPPDLTQSRCRNDTSWDQPTPCCTRECPRYAEIDLVIVMDSSSSIGKGNFEVIKSFVRQIIEEFTISSDMTHVSVLRYNRFVDTSSQILLNAFPDDKEGLLRAVDAIPYNGRGTRTGQAISHVNDVILREENGDRLDVRDVVIVITDGRSQDEVAAPSRLLREHGALTYAVGIQLPKGNLDRQQLLDIAGSEDHLEIASSGFEGLNESLLEKQRDQICRDPCVDAFDHLHTTTTNNQEDFEVDPSVDEYIYEVDPFDFTSEYYLPEY